MSPVTPFVFPCMINVNALIRSPCVLSFSALTRNSYVLFGCRFMTLYSACLFSPGSAMPLI